MKNSASKALNFTTNSINFYLKEKQKYEKKHEKNLKFHCPPPPPPHTYVYLTGV